MNSFALATIAIATVFATPALADSWEVFGSLQPGYTFNRPLAGSPPTGLSAVGTDVYYSDLTFHVDTSGSYDFALDSLAFDPFLLLYAGSFDPGQPLLNALIADDDGGPGFNSFFSYNLLAGVNYILVATAFDNGATGDFTLVVDGPGAITPGGVTPGVPEPAAWAMLITGFGMVGAGLRRRRSTMVSA